MARYLLLWKVDTSRMAESPQERAGAFSMLLAMVREDMAKGAVKDWGSYVGEMRGYAVVEGTEVEIGGFIQRYVPYVSFKSHHAASISQVEEVTKNMSG